MTVNPPHKTHPSGTISSGSEVNDSRPSISLASGEVVFADVVIGADGSGSVVRQAVEVTPKAPRMAGVVYSGSISLQTMQSDEHLKDVLKIRLPIWMGNGYYAHGEIRAVPLLHCNPRLSHRYHLLILSLAYPTVGSILVAN